MLYHQTIRSPRFSSSYSESRCVYNPVRSQVLATRCHSEGKLDPEKMRRMRDSALPHYHSLGTIFLEENYAKADLHQDFGIRRLRLLLFPGKYIVGLDESEAFLDDLNWFPRSQLLNLFRIFALLFELVQILLDLLDDFFRLKFQAVYLLVQLLIQIAQLRLSQLAAWQFFWAFSAFGLLVWRRSMYWIVGWRLGGYLSAKYWTREDNSDRKNKSPFAVSSVDWICLLTSASCANYFRDLFSYCS